MKALFVMISSVWLPTFLYAQPGTTIYYFEPGIVAVKMVYNAKNEIVARLEYTELELKYDQEKSIARGKTVKIKDGKEKETIIGNFIYDDAKLLISMGKSADGKDACLDYTPGMKPGQGIVSNLEFDTDTKFLGQTIKVCCKITNRKVLSIGETVTSSLGSWHCVKTGYSMSIKSKALGIGIPVDVYVEEWFAEGVGIVQTDVYRNGKLYERRLLTEFRKL